MFWADSRRIGELYDDLRRADFQGDKEAVVPRLHRIQADPMGPMGGPPLVPWVFQGEDTKVL